MSGKKGRSGRKTKRFEFEIARLKELSLKRAIKILEQKEKAPEDLGELKDQIRLQKRQDDITLKVIDKTIQQEVKVSGDAEGDPIKFELYLPENKGCLKHGKDSLAAA